MPIGFDGFADDKDERPRDFCWLMWLSLVKLLRFFQAHNAHGRHRFYCLFGVTTYFRSEMGQVRLHNIRLLHGHKVLTRKTNLNVIADGFIRRSTARRNTFFFKLWHGLCFNRKYSEPWHGNRCQFSQALS